MFFKLYLIHFNCRTLRFIDKKELESRDKPYNLTNFQEIIKKMIKKTITIICNNWLSKLENIFKLVDKKFYLTILNQ